MGSCFLIGAEAKSAAAEPGRSASGVARASRSRIAAGPWFFMAILLVGQPRPSTPLAAELFGPASPVVPVGGESQAVALGDFDGDGTQDLVVITSLGLAITLRGDGLGGFDRSGETPVADYSRSISVRDFDRDGSLDLAVADHFGDSVRLLMGDGRGGFSSAGDLSVGSMPASLVTGDFDGDGIWDLAVANSGDATVTILLGDGQGGFGEADAIAVGEGPGFVTTGGFDADPALDLAVVNSAGGTVSVLLGDGLGGFLPAAALQVDEDPSSATVGDFDEDGNADLAVSHRGGGDLVIFFGDGQGTFAPGAALPLDDGSSFLTAGDFNTDGTLDLAVANISATVSILLGSGNGGFSLTARLPAGENPSSIAVGDLNADGAQDLAVSNVDSDVVSVYLGDGAGDFSRAVGAVALENALFTVAAGDFNGDNRPDLAGAQGVLPGRVSILLADDSGGFSLGVELAVGNNPSSIVVGDFNPDPNSDANSPVALDLAVANLGSGTITILLGDGGGNFSPGGDVQTGGSPISISIGDFNNDLCADLAVVYFDSSGRAGILLGDGRGGFSASAAADVGAFPTDGAVGDLDRDGNLDLVVANRGSTTFSLLRGDGSGGFSSISEHPTDFESPVAVAVGDFNPGQDPSGALDLVVAGGGLSVVEGGVSLFIGDGTGGFTESSQVPIGEPGTLVFEDLNADGNLDLAVTRPFGPSVTILAGDGLGGLSRVADLQVAGDPESLVTADFNSDELPDLAVTAPPSVSVLLNQLALRADANGSNRVDGFDLSSISRLAGCKASATASSCYRREADVNLDGMTDGDDLDLVARRFGGLIRTGSPLRPSLDPNSPPPAPDTVTLQQASSDGDVLSVEVVVNDMNDAVAAADLTVRFDPAVVEYAGFSPGTYLGPREQEVMTVYEVDRASPGAIRVRISRLPLSSTTGSGPDPLVGLRLKARAQGHAMITFDPASALLDTGSGVVSGITFVDGAHILVQAPPSAPPGPRMALFPGALDFGSVRAGEGSRSKLRISNFGFSDLTITSVESSLPEFRSFFTRPFSIPAFSFVEMTLEFAPLQAGAFQGMLTIQSDDPPDRQVPLVGQADP